MARVRTNFTYGTLSSQLLIAGTTLSSTGLQYLAAVASPDYAVIILDPNRSAGAPEIVYVTAHTASATTATISRAQESTSARQHEAGVLWVHGVVSSDVFDPDGLHDYRDSFLFMGA